MAKFYAVRKGKVPGIYATWSDCESNVKGFAGAEYKSFSDELQAQNYMNGSIKNNEADKEVVKDTLESSVKPMSEVELKGMETKALKCLAYLHDNKLISESLYADASRQIDVNLKVRKTSQAVMSARGGKPFPDHVDVYVDGSYNASTNEYGYGVYMDDGEKQRILYGRGLCTEGGRNVEGEVAAAKEALSTIRLNPHYKSVTLYHDYQGIGSWADKDWQANKAYNQAYTRFVNKLRENGLSIEFKHVDGHTGVEGNEYVDKLAKIGCGMSLTDKEERFISKLSHVPGYPSTRELPELDDAPSYTMMGEYMPSV